MHKPRFLTSFSVVPFCIGTVVILVVVYIGLIATVMSYAALTVEFSQSVKNNESTVAVLEGRYLEEVENITTTDYLAEGYAVPTAKTFVRAEGTTALR